ALAGLCSACSIADVIPAPAAWALPFAASTADRSGAGIFAGLRCTEFARLDSAPLMLPVSGGSIFGLMVNGCPPTPSIGLAEEGAGAVTVTLGRGAVATVPAPNRAAYAGAMPAGIAAGCGIFPSARPHRWVMSWPSWSKLFHADAFGVPNALSSQFPCRFFSDFRYGSTIVAVPRTPRPA